ncbi:MAG TPA: aconitase X catalytic domain-containing protein [Phycisphaerae bacterium]|nr:aconitase X catalytic domain-containing protein [Phycisphaerae bacterium]HNU45032.1 aconitase X catalytic domain-containing protein [Phycisphaerae bacterium]
MNLTAEERHMLDGQRGPVLAKALDYLVQFGEAFGAERFVDVIYAHYPAEMSIYRGNVEDAVEYAGTGARVCIPTTSSTLACDLDQWDKLGCPRALYDLQAQVVDAHRRMGVLGTYTCTPQWLGFVPPKGSHIISVESSAIVYFNSVLGARTNRGGIFTRYSAVTGKYPLMGYLLDAGRRGTHLFKLHLTPDDLKHESDYSALGFHVGALVGSEVPVLDGLPRSTPTQLLALSAALATSGSVTLFHAPGNTAEADSVEQAFAGASPKATYTVTRKDLQAAYDKLTTVGAGETIDFVTLGCPHATLEQLRHVADWFAAQGKRVHADVRLWVCTNRMTRQAGQWEGIVPRIEAAGGFVVSDCCPVESHMRISTCHEHGLPTPQIRAMVTDSTKMARYVGDLIGCKTALRNRDDCLRAAVDGRA